MTMVIRTGLMYKYILLYQVLQINNATAYHIFGVCLMHYAGISYFEQKFF